MDKFRQETRNALELISDKGKIIFAALTCEKLYPNYVFFKKVTNWGDSNILAEGLSLLFQCLLNKDLIRVQNVENAILNIEKVTPNTEDFPEIFVSFALDACTSIYSSLSFLLDNNSDKIVDVAVYARDTVDMFIQEKDDLNSLDSSIDIQIEHDDFMIKEKNRQRVLIETLANIDLDIITDELLNDLRTIEPIIDLSLLR
ncbi:YjaG family protein [Mucilaginibacter sp. BJC16-A38]|uniref:YjaG family protein n=1 Tax=Mucilaginibacter phenanthrenivorans TaxID=1234842 RepID=UPI0021582FA2|nr:YjaG family protein [Mucilaginibacter phenanthrenivorans]MCR8559915.1 YjaG family protein [Mucilaginibacter phenanthrenivorans]